MITLLVPSEQASTLDFPALAQMMAELIKLFGQTSSELRIECNFTLAVQLGGWADQSPDSVRAEPEIPGFILQRAKMG